MTAVLASGRASVDGNFFVDGRGKDEVDRISTVVVVLNLALGMVVVARELFVGMTMMRRIKVVVQSH